MKPAPSKKLSNPAAQPKTPASAPPPKPRARRAKDPGVIIQPSDSGFGPDVRER